MSGGGKFDERGRLILPMGRQMYSGRLYTYADLGRIVDPMSPIYYADWLDLRAWFRADMGIQFGSTLRVLTGTSVPVLTISGTPTSLVSFNVECDSVAGGTALGQATIRYSFNDGTTWAASGVTTAASINVGNGITLACGAGTYATNQTWIACVSQWDDQSGLANHATQATASRQVPFRLLAFGGNACLDYMTISTTGLQTGNISLKEYGFTGCDQGNAGGAYLVVHNSSANGDGSEVFARNGSSLSVVRTAPSLARTGIDMATNWMADNVKRTWAMTYQGSQRTHLGFRNGLQEATTVIVSGDPPLTPINGPIYIGNRQGFGAAMRGYKRELMVFGKAPPPWVVYNLHLGMAARAPGAF